MFRNPSVDRWSAPPRPLKRESLSSPRRTIYTVTPGPAIDFAHLLNAKLLVLDDDCGHRAPGCETKTLVPAIAAFLAQP